MLELLPALAACAALVAPTLEPPAPHVAAVRVGVTDLDQSLAFYRDGLGCELAHDARDEGWIMLMSGQTPLVLTKCNAPARIAEGAAHVRLNFHTGDLDTGAAALRSAGVRQFTDRRSQVGRYLAFADPSGNRINLKLLDAPGDRPSSGVDFYNVGISVTDMAEALAFYRDSLGIAVRTDDYYPPVVVMDPAGAASFILADSATEPASSQPGQAWCGLALEVEDIHGAMRELADRGVRFERQSPVPAGPVLLAEFSDPFGNRHELIQHVAQEQAPSIDDLAWLTGTWTSHALGGELVEIWGEPANGAIVGTMRMDRDGAIAIYELFTVEQREDGPVFFIRHFEPGLVPWASEAENALTMRVTAIEPRRLVMENIADQWPRTVTYERTSDPLGGERLTAVLDGDDRGVPRTLRIEFTGAGLAR